jgi:dienelactone hydrolase
MGRKANLIAAMPILIMISCCVTTQPTESNRHVPQVTEQSIKLATEDNKNISATFYPPPSPNAPGVILIPDTRCDRSFYDDFDQDLNRAGFAVLSMDLRYKDLISQARSKEDAIDLIKRQDLYAPIKYDIKSGIDFLTSQKGVNPSRIALIGSSFGSREALIAGARYAKIKALVLVLLSGEEAIPGGKTVKALLEEYGNRPVLFMTSEKDWEATTKLPRTISSMSNGQKGKKS